ncbi:MAG: TonB family protein [Flavobacteriaceae bacterium]
MHLLPIFLMLIVLSQNAQAEDANTASTRIDTPQENRIAPTGSSEEEPVVEASEKNNRKLKERALEEAFKKARKGLRPNSLEKHRPPFFNEEDVLKELDRVKLRREIVESLTKRITDTLTRSDTFKENIKVYLRIDLRIQVENNGDLVDVKILRSSGDDRHDREVMKAVRSASPFHEIDQVVDSKWFDEKFRFITIKFRPPRGKGLEPIEPIPGQVTGPEKDPSLEEFIRKRKEKQLKAFLELPVSEREAVLTAVSAAKDAMRNRIAKNIKFSRKYKSLDSSEIYVILGLGNGYITELRIEKSSGDERVDQAVLNAVSRSAPFVETNAFDEILQDVHFRRMTLKFVLRNR